MTIELVGKVRSTLKSTDHPYMQGAWTPTFNEWNAIFTNGDADYAGRVLEKLGLSKSFEAIHDIHACAYQPKPHVASYETMLANFGVDPTTSLFVMERFIAPISPLRSCSSVVPFLSARACAAASIACCWVCVSVTSPLRSSWPTSAPWACVMAWRKARASATPNCPRTFAYGVEHLLGGGDHKHMLGHFGQAGQIGPGALALHLVAARVDRIDACGKPGLTQKLQRPAGGFACVVGGAHHRYAGGR